MKTYQLSCSHEKQYHLDSLGCPTLRVGLEFSKFPQQERGSDVSHEKGGVGKIGGCLKKEGVSLVFILTNPFQCYLSPCWIKHTAMPFWY